MNYNDCWYLFSPPTGGNKNKSRVLHTKYYQVIQQPDYRLYVSVCLCNSYLHLLSQDKHHSVDSVKVGVNTTHSSHYLSEGPSIGLFEFQFNFNQFLLFILNQLMLEGRSNIIETFQPTQREY